MTSSTKIIADSISEDGVRLTSFQSRFRRKVLSEFNTHCILSRNSRSSRAVPALRLMQEVMDDPAYPPAWRAEQKGMTAGDVLAEDTALECQDEWHEAAMDAVFRAQKLQGKGVHKSQINRLLEPFMWHDVVVTATAWENFFYQRCHPDADPEIREVAELMQAAYRASIPQNCYERDWHLPYADDAETVNYVCDELGYSGTHPLYWPTLAKISASRCAMVSWRPFDAEKADVPRDLARYEKLAGSKPIHWSPSEHVATPWADNRQRGTLHFFDNNKVHEVRLNHLPRVGKLLAWRSLRTTEEAKRREITFR